MDKHAELADRVLKFNLMELPGQPKMMHMGTSYLVNDLWAYIEELERELRYAGPISDMTRNFPE